VATQAATSVVIGQSGVVHHHVRRERSVRPKEVAALQPATLLAAVKQAEASFAEATDLDVLVETTAGRTRRQVPGSARPPRDRRVAASRPGRGGQRVQETQAEIKAAYERRHAELTTRRDERMLREEAVDVTLPWDRIPRGARHPITTLSERISDVFVAMGWEVADGPEVETEWFNFDALNTGKDHPARTLQDTFYVAPANSGWYCDRRPRRCRSGRC